MRPILASHRRAWTGTPARSTTTVDALDGLERHRARVEAGEPLDLPALVVELLAEVAVVVEEPDGDEREAEVVGGLQVVAGEHAEAAGVQRAGPRRCPNSGLK